MGLKARTSRPRGDKISHATRRTPSCAPNRLTEANVKRYFRVRRSLISYTTDAMRRVGERVPGWAEMGLRDETPWPDQQTIDSFVAENPSRLDASELALAMSWKNAVAGCFFAVRHLPNYTVFVSEDRPYKTYAAIGHQSDLSVVLFKELPELYEVRFLPFEGRIVCNLVAFLDEYPGSWSASLRRVLEAVYRRAISDGRIITSLA